MNLGEGPGGPWTLLIVVKKIQEEKLAGQTKKLSPTPQRSGSTTGESK